MEELKPMTAAAFFNVTTCLVLPERCAGCLAVADVVDGAGRVLAKAGERITTEQQMAILAAADAGELPSWENGYIRVVLEIGECSCCNG